MPIRAWLAAAALAALSWASSATAQLTHSALLDLDSNAATGCTVTTAAGAFGGIEVRVDATVSGQPPQVSSVSRASCVGSAFGPPQAQPAGYPVGLNNGTGGADVVEWSTALAGLGSGGLARIVFVSASATGADAAIANGVALPGSAAVPTQPAVIPATGWLALLALIALVIVIVRKHPRFGSSMALLLLFGAGVVWAANFVTDGQVADWAGVSPRATDPANDSTSSESTIDIVAAFAEAEAGNLFFRVDIREAQNQSPTASAQSVTVNEDGSLLITLSGMDPEAAALTFSIASGPTRGTLTTPTPASATTATVTYTPNPNVSGTDSFAFTVSDGASTSTAATVAITITAVNDSPVVAAQAFSVAENAPNGTAVGTVVATDADTGQTLTWSILSGNTDAAFAINASTGVITVADASDVIPANSPFSLSVQASDNGVPVLSGSGTVTITVTSVNDEPTFTGGPNQTVLEDAGAQSVVWATNISPGPADESAQTVSFTVTNDNNALFAAQPAIAPNGTLTYTPAPNANGSATVSVTLVDSGGTAGGGDNTSPMVTFTITVTAVNDAPVVASQAFSVVENSPTGTVVGTAVATDPDTGQTLTWSITLGNTGGAFAINASTGVITVADTNDVTPANSPFSLTVQATDNGVPVLSGTGTVTVTVTSINDEPSFTSGPDQTVLEDAGAQSLIWATNILPGPADETGQTVSFTVTNDNSALFAVQPTIAPDGTLTYTPAANAYGSATVSVTLVDSGGTAGGGDNTSPTVTFTIIVNAVNDTPSFALPASPNRTVLQNSAAFSESGFATAILAGPANESAQTLSFTVTAGDSSLFSVQPAISPTGTLTFTPANNAVGSTTITVTLSDNGGGADTSAPQTFTISVSLVNQPPTFTATLDPTVNEDAGATSLSNFVTGIDDGDATATQNVSFTITGNTNPGLFTVAPTIAPDGTLSFTPAPNLFGGADITFVAVDDGGTALPGSNDTSAPDTFRLRVDPVNDPPSFQLPASPNRGVLQNSGAFTEVGFATNIISGPPNESIQGVNFLESNDNPGLFSAQPEISSTGTLTFTPANGAIGSATVTVSLIDDGGLDDTSAPQTFVITVSDVNDAPDATATPAAPFVSEFFSVNGLISQVSVADPDVGQTHTFVIESGNTSNRFTIDGAGDLRTASALDFENGESPYVLVIRVTDNGTPALSDTVTVTVTVTDNNEDPAFTSPAAFSVVEDTTAVGTVVAADPESAVLTYAISGGADAALFGINSSTGALSFLAAPNFEAPGDAGANNVYNLIVSASDGIGAPTQSIAVTVTNTNDAPVFTSTSTPSVPENSTAVLTVATTDGDGDTRTYSITAGADAALFTINATTGALAFLVAPNFEAPSDADTDNAYQVVVAANDGTVAPTQALTVTVTDVNEAPEINSLNTFFIEEDNTAVAQVSAIDPEGATLTYAISGGADGALFGINASTGALVFLAAPNFEAPADAGGDNNYNVVVSASDGTNAPTQAITVIVTNTNDAPVFTSSATPSAAENQTAVVIVNATDGDGDTVTYSITGGVDAFLFTIDSNTGVLTFLAPPNFEAPADSGGNNVYNLVVTATDGNFSPTQAISVTVTDANEPPSITSGAAFAVAENGTAVGTVTSTDPESNTVTYSLTGGADQARFSINTTTGALTFLVAPNFEAPTDANTDNAYIVQVSANDGTSTVNQTVTVTVTDVQEGPSFTSANAASYPENGTAAVSTVTATDPEGDSVSYAITGGADSADMAINATTGALSFVSSPNFEAPADADTNNTYIVQITATSTGGTAVQTLTVTVTDVNEAPTITSAAPGAVAENTVGTIHTVTATDPDGTTPTFAISGGADAADFAINATTGALSFVVSPNFEAPADADANNVYAVTVRATDGTLFDDEPYTVTVMNVNEAPSAGADAYSYIGNTELRIAGHAGVAGAIAFTTAATNPLANDTDPDSLASGFGTLAVVPVASGTSANNGSFTLAADGTMRYTPPAGFSGADSVTYQLTDGANVVAGTMNFTFTGSDMVWYVKNNDPTVDGTATRDGTSSFPYNTLAGASTASGVSHIIYVHSGDGTTTGQNAGIVLKNGQELYGQGVALVVNGATTLIAAGAQPQIGNSGGAAVSSTNLTGVVVRGLNIGATTDAVFATTTGANGGSIEVGDNTIRAAGTEGIDIDGLGTGAFNISIHDNAITATGNAIDVNRTAGTLTITAFDDNNISGNSGAIGINMAGAVRFDAVPGGLYDAVAGGTTTVGSAGNGVGTAAVNIGTVSGDLGFTTLNLFASNGAALAVAGSGVFNAGAGTGFRITATSGTDVYQAINGSAVSITNATVNLAPNTVTSTGATNFGLIFDVVAGTFAAGASSSISAIAPAATAYRINASSLNATYTGSITLTQGTGVSLTTNTGVYSFTGALNLVTGASPAFSATSSGTLTATNVTSVLSTTTATALNVTGTTIGLAGLRFASISAGTAITGAAFCINLQNTGTAATSGGLTVLGGPAAGNGGTLQRCGTGVNLSSTRDVVLNDVNMSNFSDWAIRGATVVNFNADNLVISGANGDNDATDDGAIRFTNLSGAGTLSNSAVSGGWEDNIAVVNDSGSLNRLVISNTAMGANGTTFGNDGMFFEASGSAVVNVSVTGSTFTATRGDHVQFSAAGGTPAGDFVLAGNTFTNNHPAAVSGAGGIRVTTGGGSATVSYTISNNTISGARGTAIGATEGAGVGVVNGTIDNNDIGSAGVANSGSLEGSGISVVMADLGTHRSTITGNDIRQYNNHGIITQAGGGATPSSGNLKLVITGNAIGNPGNQSFVPGKNGFHLNSGTMPGDTFAVCLDLGGAGALQNQLTGAGDLVGAGQDFRLRQRQSTTVRMPGYGGGAGDDAAVISYIQGRNAAGASGNVTNASAGWLGGACPF